MSATTGIEWTDATWNPWVGCTKVSPGCAHCYMFRGRARYRHDPEVVTRSRTTFGAPLAWTGTRVPGAGRGLVFTCSWSDFFHEAADPWRDEAWDIIRRTPHLTYQILTKRPERFAACLPADWGLGYANVWLGVSVETPRQMDRAAVLAATPARLRFLSCEPLLGPVSLRTLHDGIPNVMHPIDWVIIGGESGPRARPMELQWARELRDECEDYDIPCFLKQLGGMTNPRAHELALLDGKRHVEMPAGYAPREVAA